MKDSSSENEQTDLARALWCRLIDGAQPSREEQAALQDALRSNDRLRQECDTDATVHSLLLSMNDVKQSQDSFVQAVMSVIKNGPADSASSEAGIDAGPSARPVRAPRRQVFRSGMAISLTVMIFVAAGVLGWRASVHHQGENADLRVQGPAGAPATEKNSPGDRPSQVPADSDAADSTSPAFASDTAANRAPNIDFAATPPRMAEADPAKSGDTTAAQAEEPAEALSAAPFVTLTKIENPVWERSWVEGDRIGSNVVRLFGGRLELSFDDGAKVIVEGPIEFLPLTSGHLQLRRGRLMATVPKEAIGFTVSTPTSQVVDLGTEFEVSVKQTGASEIVVQKGEIEVMPATARGKVPRKWRLVPNGLNQASFFERTGEEETSPVSAAIRGVDGAFQGMISINGNAAEFSSAEAFDEVRNRVLEQLEKSQLETMQQWTDFVESMQKNVRGKMQLNGAEVEFGSFEDALQLQQQMLERMQIPRGAPLRLPDSNFSGSININGKIIAFRTREEYESARRSAFGAAANFGAGDFFERRKSGTGGNTRGRRP
ncbi:MAG: FecR family protein [Planctomycetaceae bacterium]